MTKEEYLKLCHDYDEEPSWTGWIEEEKTWSTSHQEYLVFLYNTIPPGNMRLTKGLASKVYDLELEVDSLKQELKDQKYIIDSEIREIREILALK